MYIKIKLKNSALFPILIYLRYFINRYFVCKRFRSSMFYQEVRLESVDDGINFFGYYNISPQNQNGEIIYLKVNKEKIRGSLHEPASIMLKNQDGSIKKVTESKAWNWQQGCMLQWHPKDSNKIIYNDYDRDKDIFISKVIDKSGKIINTYNLPVNNVSKCGEYALTLNYDRLVKMRPDYGYFNRKKSSLPSNENDGIWKIDFDASKIDLIISLEQLKKMKYVSSMNGAEHKVNHIDINPDGTRFMFLHRWIGPKGRFMRLITADPDGRNLKILNGDIMTSHSCWLNNDEILSFCEVNGERGYFKFEDKSNKVSLFSEKFPIVDGHPSISPNGKFIITDTYPDKSRFSSLFLYDRGKDKMIEVGKFYQPLRYNKEIRIDLHPKWGKDSKTIFIESGHSSSRKLFKIGFTEPKI